MLTYEKSFFSLNLLCRVHGSAAYKATIPSLLSCVLYMIFYSISIEHTEQGEKLISHPYAVGGVITSVAFVVVFRANYAYQRYWDGSGNIYQMMSKWMDAVTMMGAFHYQSEHYEKLKPPSFFRYPGINFQAQLSRKRNPDLIQSNGFKGSSLSGATADSNSNDQFATKNSYLRQDFSRCRKSSLRSINGHGYHMYDRSSSMNCRSSSSKNSSGSNASVSIHDEEDCNHNRLKCFDVDNSMPYPYRSNFNRPQFQIHSDDGISGPGQVDGGITCDGAPSLFMQELIHLASLLNAVALSTLRDEFETSHSPLDEYIPGKPWPSVDDSDVEKDLSLLARVKRVVLYWCWLDQSSKHREEYHASRPLLVIGGVSEGEVLALQRARGAEAKVNLCWFWLIEFIQREHMAGSTGAVAPPIISRVHQFLSDGGLGYNSARRISFIPFPFPHAQISLLSMVFLAVATPIMTLEYSDRDTWYIGIFLTFSIVEVLFGLHEVARELENPFKTIPNELPLCALQAQFNESLLVLTNGYHPDAFWNTKSYLISQSTENGDIDIAESKRKSQSGARSRQPKNVNFGEFVMWDAIHTVPIPENDIETGQNNKND